MKGVPIDAARRLGAETSARRVVIISVDGDDFCITTWGKTREECRALAKWAESETAADAVAGIADA